MIETEMGWAIMCIVLCMGFIVADIQQKRRARG